MGIRDIYLETSIDYKLSLKDVRHVQNIHLNLIFISKLDDVNIYVSIILILMITNKIKND